MDAAVVEEEMSFQLTETDFSKEFPKRLSCIAHALNNMCHSVLYKLDCPIEKLKKKILPLVNRISKSEISNQTLKELTGKKLLKVSKIRWNSFFYVVRRLYALKGAIIQVCQQQD